MDPVLENVLGELQVDLPGDADIPVVASAPARTWIWSDREVTCAVTADGCAAP